ncbi:MAG TPA: ATPase, T2SS/T4P/T4SS family [Candidatus Paceibacterota bacterium]|nr:ATPase, T2SS/T4P/T4SS family [Candidatus Paceibacterota bacterium]
MQVDEGQLRDFLIDSGLMTRSQVADATRHSQEESLPLYTTLSQGGYLAADELRRALAHASGVAFVQLKHDDISANALVLIPEPVARTYNMVAFKQDGNIVEVAMLDLADLSRIDFLREKHGLTIVPRLTTAESIKRALHIYQKHLKEKFSALLQHGTTAVDALIHHAILSYASGVHLDLHDTSMLVRYRIQGVLHEAMRLPADAATMLERLKELAKLSLTLHVPQEGSFRVEMEGGDQVGVRVATAPTANGERMVLHLTPDRVSSTGFTLSSLGLHGQALEEAHHMLQTRSGLIVVAGRAGAGKTTTLYTLLDNLSQRDAAIATIESEIEHRFPHIAQTQVRPDIGVTYASGLRALLKQDPDMVMVGELNDEKTAALAAAAAARGVLVLAGVDLPAGRQGLAAAAIEVLRGFGISDHLLASTLRGVIGVEVVRKLCKEEREEYRLSRAEGEPMEGRANFGHVLAQLKEEGIVHKDLPWKELLFARAEPCSNCEDGYVGQVGLQEVLPITATIKEKLMAGALAEDIEALARADGMTTTIEDGLFKAAQGITSVEEVVRVV